MIQKWLTLWETEAVEITPGGGAHQWLAGGRDYLGNEQASAIYNSGVAATHIPDNSAPGGVLKRIPMNGYEYLRIYGEIVCVDAAGYTATNMQLRPYAMGRMGGKQSVKAIRDAEPHLGVDIVPAGADQDLGFQALGNYAWRYNNAGANYTRGGAAIAHTSDWTGSIGLLRGDTNEEEPFLKAANPADGDVRRWWYDVGESNEVSLADQVGDRNMPFVMCRGFSDVWVALKIINAGAGGATGGAGNLTIGGRIVAIRMRRRGGSTP